MHTQVYTPKAGNKLPPGYTSPPKSLPGSPQTGVASFSLKVSRLQGSGRAGCTHLPGGRGDMRLGVGRGRIRGLVEQGGLARAQTMPSSSSPPLCVLSPFPKGFSEFACCLAQPPYLGASPCLPHHSGILWLPEAFVCHAQPRRCHCICGLL